VESPDPETMEKEASEMLFRRNALLLPMAALAGCATPDPPPPPLAALEADAAARPAAPALRLDAAMLEFAPLQAGPAMITVAPVPLTPADAMVAMARERLFPAGVTGKARFIILTALFMRHPSSSGGLFNDSTEALSCTMRCAVEILSPDDELRSYTRAEATLSARAPASSLAESADSATRLVRLTTAALAQDLERATRRDLRGFLLGGGAA
jgi:hypothetical protein